MIQCAFVEIKKSTTLVSRSHSALRVVYTKNFVVDSLYSAQTYCILSGIHVTLGMYGHYYDNFVKPILKAIMLLKWLHALSVCILPRLFDMDVFIVIMFLFLSQDTLGDAPTNLQTARAANVIYSLFTYRKLLDKNKLRPVSAIV